MLSYFLSPLDMHFDLGFGAVADSFQDAAETLEKECGRHHINGHLPICYLYRHSIELYLKASIIIFHRGLKLPYGDKPHDGDPYLHQGSKWISLYNEHQIQLLYSYLNTLLIDNKEYLEKHTHTNWTFPADLSSKVQRIQSIDASSAFFRYPVSKDTNQDKEKSAYKRTSADEVIAQALKQKKPLKATMTMDFLGRPKQVFAHDDTFTEEAILLLRDVTATFGACHIALIHEIAGGGLSLS